MKRETLVELGLNKEQMDVVFAEHGKTITDLKGRLEVIAKERDELQQSFNSQKEDLEQQYTEHNKDFAIKHTLKTADLHDNELVLGLLDKDKIMIDDNGVNGLNEQLETLRTEKSFLFKQAKPNTPTITVGGNPRPAQVVDKDAFSNIAEKYDQ